MPFSISELLSSLNRYRSPISISLVSVWEVNCVLFNSMLKYVIYRLMHAFFHIRTVIIPLWHLRYLRMGKIDVITYKYVIQNLNLIN
jgi:hypothetical protein